MNTPACSACGYAVEWLRSCYSSVWKLFSDGRTTRGFYYFSDPSAPFYPGPHNLGSRNWVSEDLVNPPLGEQTGRQVWRDGSLPVPRPPATLVGSADCLALGSGTVSLTLVRTLPAGIDSRCYPVGGVPPLQPILWLVPDQLPAVNELMPIFLWPDISVYNRTVSNTDPATAPQFDNIIIVEGDAVYSQVLFHNVDPPLTLNGDYAMVAVAQVNTQLGWSEANLAVASGGGGSCLFGVKPSFVLIRQGPTVVQFNTGVTFANQPFVFTSRRVSGVCQLRVNGVVKGQTSVFGSSPLQVFGVARTKASAPNSGNICVAEMRVYDGPQSDAELLAIENQLRATYGI